MDVYIWATPNFIFDFDYGSNQFVQSCPLSIIMQWAWYIQYNNINYAFIFNK